MCQKHTISRFVHGSHPSTHSARSVTFSAPSLFRQLFLSPFFPFSVYVQCLILNGVASCARFGYRAIEQRQQQCINSSSTQHNLKRSRTDVGIHTESLRTKQEFDVVTVLSPYTHISLCVCIVEYICCVMLHCRALVHSLPFCLFRSFCAQMLSRPAPNEIHLKHFSCTEF